MHADLRIASRFEMIIVIEIGPEGDWVVLVGFGLGLELRMRFVSRPCSGKEER